MKKFSFIMVVLVLFASVLTGCASGEDDIILVSFSDSIPGVHFTSEPDVKEWRYKWGYQSPNAEKELTYTIGDLELYGKYDYSATISGEYYEMHYYNNFFNGVDASDGSYYFAVTDAGDLCGFSDFYSVFYGDSEINTKIYTKEECTEIACEFLSNLVDISQYTVTASDLLEYGEKQYYRIDFHKYVNGILSQDQACIRVLETGGQFWSFSSIMLGRIDPDAKPQFDMEDVEARLIKKLDLYYSELKESKGISAVTYENFSYTVVEDDEGEFYLIARVEVRFGGTSDLLTFVVR